MKQYIYLAIMLVLLMVLLVGCSRLGFLFRRPQPGDSGNEGSDGSTSTTTSQPSDNSGGGAGDKTWTKDVLLTDDFTPTQELSAVEPVEISTAIADAVSVQINFEEQNVKAEGIDSRSGGVDADYSVMSAKEGVSLPAGTAAYLSDWNARALERAKTEVEEGVIRREAYLEKDKSDYLFISSWVCLRIERSDSQIFSAYELVYRYNREQEPNFYEIHGVTIDAVSGKALSLNDFFTDVEALKPALITAIETQGVNKWPADTSEDLAERIMKAIRGCRDDGSFAWTIGPAGFEFEYICAYQTNHHLKRIFVPFNLCEGFLREGVTEVPYDYMVCLDNTLLQTMGIEMPVIPEDGSAYFKEYVGQKDGVRYLYGSDEGKTDIYTVDGTMLSTIVGEIRSPYYWEPYTTIDPENIVVDREWNTFIWIDLTGQARLTDGGALEMIGLFTTNSNPMPFSNILECEAETFDGLLATESHLEKMPTPTYLMVVRSDGATFIDCYGDRGDEKVYRLYIGGSEEDGWTINGVPEEQWIGHKGYFEE